MRKEDQAPIAGVGILVGKFSEHSGKAGKVYILSLAPGSAAAELQRKSRASKGVPDIAENDLLVRYVAMCGPHPTRPQKSRELHVRVNEAK